MGGVRAKARKRRLTAGANKRLAIVLHLAAAIAAAGCSADQPVLTLVFEHVPIGTRQLDVTLHGTLAGMNATFMGPDAGNSQVGVSYAGGNVVIMIDPAYAAARANHIRLPLTAGKDIALEGTASATDGGETKTVVTSTLVMAHQSATMKFDFASTDGGPDDSADGGTDASPETGAMDANPDADAGADTGLDTRMDVTGDGADVRGDSSSSDVPMDTSSDVPADMVGSDVPADMSVSDVPADVVSPPDTPGDATIAPNCTLGGQYAASVGIGGSGPTVAYAAPLFGVAWKAGNDILYNAVSATGTLQITGADKTVVAGAGQGLNTPRLARLGTDFVLAYGRHDGTGAQATVVRVTPATGVATPPASMGTNRPGIAAAPDLGGVAISGDQKKIAVISRAADLAAQTAAIVDEFNDGLTFVTAKMPAALGTSRTTGIGWAPGRFLAGVVTDATSAGGTLLELSDDTNLTIGSTHPFTSGAAAPVVGSGAATISVAGAGDRVAVAWVDLQSGRRVITLAVVPFSSGTPGTPVPASTSAATKYYPHLIFDGAAFVVAWIEGSSSIDAQIVLRRFDTNLNPVGAPMNVGAAGAVNLGDFDITAAGPNVYGIAAAGSSSTQRLFYLTCN